MKVVTSIVALAVVIATCLGVDYGGVCNGVINQCNRYNETVLCMHRRLNETIGAETCETGLGVDLGRCQCRRNCAADGTYVIDGEFDVALQVCVGFVGKSCQVYPRCTANAYCDPVTRTCRCGPGFVPDTEGLRCRAQ